MIVYRLFEVVSTNPVDRSSGPLLLSRYRCPSCVNCNLELVGYGIGLFSRLDAIDVASLCLSARRTSQHQRAFELDALFDDPASRTGVA